MNECRGCKNILEYNDMYCRNCGLKCHNKVLNTITNIFMFLIIVAILVVCILLGLSFILN